MDTFNDGARHKNLTIRHRARHGFQFGTCNLKRQRRSILHKIVRPLNSQNKIDRSAQYTILFERPHAGKLLYDDRCNLTGFNAARIQINLMRWVKKRVEDF